MEKLPLEQLAALNGNYLIRPNEDKMAASSATSRADVAKAGDKFNTSQELQRTFFEPNETILYTETTPSGGQVTVMVPSGPYSEHGVMVIAKGPHSLGKDDEQVATQTIYDLPKDVQEAYWRCMKICLDFYQQEAGEEGMIVYSTENCIKFRSNAEWRTSRTIALPHTHIVPINVNHIQKGKPVINDLHLLDAERHFLQSEPFMNHLLKTLTTELKTHGIQHLDGLKIQTQAPFGFTFVVDEEDLPDTMAQLHNALEKSSHLFADISPQVAKLLIPQPSYRIYTATFKESKRQILISPELVSPTGPLEAHNLSLHRKKENPIHTPQEKVQMLRAKLSNVFVGNLESVFA